MREARDFTWEEVGARLRRWRLAAGISQSELASKAGLTQAGLATVEAGGHDPRLTTLRRLARALGRSTRELICGRPEPPAPVVGGIQQRVRRVLESHNLAAMTVFHKGLETAELMVSSRERGNGKAPQIIPLRRAS
jgi:DNA-binding XRE family transcriptional regulator